MRLTCDHVAVLRQRKFPTHLKNIGIPCAIV